MQMIKYRFRWVSASFLGVVLFLAGYIYILRPEFIQLALLKQTEVELNKILKDLQAQKPIKEIKKSDESFKEKRAINLASDISILAERMRFNGLTVHGLDVLEGNERNRLLAFVHAEVEGGVTSLMSFLDSISSPSPLLIMLLDFHFRPGKENIFVLDMNFLLTREQFFQQFFDGPGSWAKNMNNVFCPTHGEMTVIHRSSQQEALSTSVNHMKMTGYVCQGNQVEAFLRLPNEHLISVKPGSLLGKERGVVSAISPERLEVHLSDGRKYVYQLH